MEIGKLILDAVVFGYVLNILAVAFSFLYLAFCAWKGGEGAINKMKQLEVVFEERRNDDSRVRISYNNLLVPFGHAYWTFVFFTSYIGYNGDVFDKMLNYYTYN